MSKHTKRIFQFMLLLKYWISPRDIFLLIKHSVHGGIVTPLNELLCLDSITIFHVYICFFLPKVTIFFVGIFGTGVIGNLIVCVVIVKNASMHTATNYYLFSLAVSDLLFLMMGEYQAFTKLNQVVNWICNNAKQLLMIRTEIGKLFPIK